MPIQSGDIAFRNSGGASNAVALLSLGGVKSSVAAAGSLFDNVDGAESTAGDTEYRCIYVHVLVAATEDVKLWIPLNTPSGSTTFEIGVGTSAIDGVEQTVANENTAPSGVTFTAAANLAAGISLGTLGAGQHRAVWVRRIINAATGAITGDTVTFRTTAA